MATIEEFFGEPRAAKDKMFGGDPSFEDLVPDDSLRADIMRVIERRNKLLHKENRTDADLAEIKTLSERPAIGHTLQETIEAGRSDAVQLADASLEAHNLSVREGDREPLSKSEMDEMYANTARPDDSYIWAGRTRLERPQIKGFAGLISENNARRTGVMDRTDRMYDSEEQLTPQQALSEALRKKAGARSYPTELAQHYGLPEPTMAEMEKHYGFRSR